MSDNSALDAYGKQIGVLVREYVPTGHNLHSRTKSFPVVLSMVFDVKKPLMQLQALNPYELTLLIDFEGHEEHPFPDPLLYVLSGHLHASGVSPGNNAKGQGLHTLSALLLHALLM